MTLNADDILTLLLIVAVGLLIILIYNLIIVSMNLRRITDRANDLTKQVEAVILKPLSTIDYVLDWFATFVDGMRSKHEHKKKHID